MKARASIKNGKVIQAEGITPEYHGNPVEGNGGQVTVDMDTTSIS